jgi:hypothetical protein
MNKVTGVLLFAVVVFCAAFMVLNFEVAGKKIKILILLDGSLRKKTRHAWCFSNCGGATGEANGYASDNVDC